MNTKTRLLEFVDFKSISKREFCKKSSLSHTIFNNNSAIGSDKLEKIHNVFEELNMDWVITGRGEMIYKKETKNMNIKIDNSYEIEWKEIPFFLTGFLKLCVENGLTIGLDNRYYKYDAHFNTIINEDFYNAETKGKSAEDKYKVVPVIERFIDWLSSSGVNRKFLEEMNQVFLQNATNIYFEVKRDVFQKNQQANSK